MTKRQAVHDWIDDLPDDAIEQVEALLEQLQRDRLKEAFANAPEEDEELTPAEMAAIERRANRTTEPVAIPDGELEDAIRARLRADR
ncbi:MAG: hypothetical protein ACKVVT_05410 [Dehalococcoidia bacterium]